jgi:hypothetical protein
MKSWQIALLGVVVIGVLIYTNVITIPNFSVPGQTGAVTTVTAGSTVTAPVTVPAGFQPGDFIDDVMGYNTFTPSTTSTLGAIGTCVWYIYVGGGYSSIGASTGGTLQVPASSGGYVYAAVQGTTNIYIDAWTTKSSDAKIESMSYQDLDGNGVKEFVFKINLASVTRQSGYTPHFALNLYWMDYEAPTMGDVSDVVTTVGSSQVDKYYEFSTSQSTLNRAYAIYKTDVYIEKCLGTYSPQADTAKFIYVKQQIPGKGYVDLTPSMQIRTYDLLYTYTLGTDMGDAYYIKTSQNDLNKQYFTLNVKFNFAGSDPEYRICWTLYYIAPTATGNASPTTDTDSVWVKAT